MTKNKYFSSSRKKTPWDDVTTPSCLQSFIRDEYKDHFYMHHISLEESNEERILIDQLLITGNGSNRFMSCIFSNGRLDFKTAQIVTPSEFFRKETVEWLHDNYSYVENSILTEEQRQMKKDKIVF